jgi:membrane-bound lytic murein transglycosylase B
MRLVRAFTRLFAAGLLLGGAAGCAGTTPKAAEAAAPAPPLAVPVVADASTQAAPAPLPVVAATPIPEPQPKPEADVLFYRFLEAFRGEAVEAGIKPETYDRAIFGLTLNTRVGELNASQPEFVRPIWDYLASATTDLKVANGREMLTLHAVSFDRIEAAYGVPRHVLAAIWGQETAYGRVTGNFNLFQALATLAYDGPRQTFARREFIAALKIAEAEGIDPQTMKGSWAGAFGHTQFIPTTFLAHAVDGDGDMKRDLWNSPADALASAASYLRKSGWQSGQAWGQEVRLPENFPYEEADYDIRKPQREWVALGIRSITGQELPSTDEPVAIFLPAGGRGPAFLLRDNFRVIMKYNNATAYALGISVLSDRLRGAEGVVGTWPLDERPLTRTQAVTLQEGLVALGYLNGAADGVLGRQTRGALRSYQKARGLMPDGFATLSLLARIESERAAAPPQ